MKIGKQVTGRYFSFDVLKIYNCRMYNCRPWFLLLHDRFVKIHEVYCTIGKEKYRPLKFESGYKYEKLEFEIDVLRNH